MNIYATAQKGERNMIVAESIEEIEADLKEAIVRNRKLPDGIEEELVAENRAAEIREYPSRSIRRRYSLEFDLVDALWCEFPTKSDDEESMRSICLVGEEGMLIAADADGHVFPISLPLKIKRVLGTSLGLLLQRDAADASVKGCPPLFPHLFALSHPYDEILPVICRNKDSESTSHYVWNSSEMEIVESFDEYELVLTYSPMSRTHSMYWVRKAEKSEWKLAAARAESLVSSAHATPKGATSLSSTPLYGSQSRHRSGRENVPAEGDSWQTPQTSCVRTRSMTAAAALIHSLPFPGTSPAQRSTSRSLRDSPLFRLRQGSAHTTPRLGSYYEDSIISLIEMRGAEFDLLAPEVCMECVWTEPSRRQHDHLLSKCASLAFVTKDFIGQTYACFFVKEHRLLKCIRIKEHSGRFTVGTLTTINCCGAANVTGNNMMVVIEPDMTAVVYSGVTRIGSLYAHYSFGLTYTMSTSQDFRSSARNLSLCSPVKNIHSSVEGAILMETMEDEFLRCKLPPLVSCMFVSKCLSQVCVALPLDKAMKLSKLWCVGNIPRTLSNYPGNRAAAEFVLFIEMILSQCGIDIKNFPTFREMKMFRTRCSEGVCEKRKRPDNSRCIQNPWQRFSEAMQRSDWWTVIAEELEKFDAHCTYDVTIINDRPLFSHCLAVLTGLHTAYETYKLDIQCRKMLFLVASFLHAFSSILELTTYVTYYQKDFPSLKRLTFRLTEEGLEAVNNLLSNARFSFERIPSWHDSLVRILSTETLSAAALAHFMPPVLITIAVGMERIASTADLQRIIGKSFDKKLRLSRTKTNRLVQIFDKKNYSVLRKCEELARLFNITYSTMLDLPPSYALILCELLYNHFSKSLSYLATSSFKVDRRSMPTEEEQIFTACLRWQRDLRITNVLQMLDAQRPIFLPPTGNSLPEAEQRELYEEQLQTVARRAVSHSFGRAAAELRVESPAFNRPLLVPKVCVQGRALPSNTPVELPQNDTTKPMLEWGMFYNATAASIRVTDKETIEIDCEWLTMSAGSPSNTSNVGPTVAGMMYGFGLNGHITSMNLFTVHELLSSGDLMMNIAILLGYAVASRASSDVQVHKLILPHLPFMMGPTLLELHIDPMVQTAALVSLGLLFAQSSHLGILGQLVNEIGRPASPEHEPYSDRYSYSLAAGFATGLIALGRGEELSASIPFVQRYPSLPDRLVVLMKGGLRSLCYFPTSPHSDLLPSNAQPHPPQQSNHVKESSYVNPHLTAPAATVALGLMYLRTGSTWAARSLKIPETISAIEKIRPDVLLLRCLCRHLVLWDSIKTSKSWVESTVPPLILEYKTRLFSDTENDENKKASDKGLLEAAVDKETVAQTYLNVIAGSCFAMSLRFASSCNAQAFETIMHYAMMVAPMVDGKAENICAAASIVTCCTVINTLMYSLAILMAGSGNLQALRLCRWLRNRVMVAKRLIRENVSYSVYAAVNVTLGFLVMGYGRFALKTDDLSIAAMVVAFFPVSPHSISDNRMYLQALRFLWVIAADERLLCPLEDDDFKNFIKAEVEVTYKETSVSGPDVLKMRTPCLLPELRLLQKVVVRGHNFEQRVFHLNHKPEFDELQRILKEQHGKISLRALGGRHQEGTFLSDHYGKGSVRMLESVLKETPIPEDDIMKAVNFEHLLTSGVNFSDTCSKEDLLARIATFEEHIRDFQAKRGSVLAHDCMLAFVKDVLSDDPLKFADLQYQQMENFLLKCDEDSGLRKTYVIPSELVLSLR